MALPQRYIVGPTEKEFYTEDEYFEFEQSALGRWEYVGGDIRAMAGGSDDHGAIASNVLGTLHAALLPKGCRVYGSDIKIHCGDGTNTFPDVTVVCGPRQYHRGRTDTIINPVLIVEVLSPSTEGYDRSEKFDHYQTISSLMDYLLVAQDQTRVMRYTRQGDSWEFQSVTDASGSIILPSVDVTLALSDVYALIDFEENRR